MSSVSSILSGGLDISTIVSNLMYVEQAPLRRLQSQKTTLQNQLSAFNTVNSNLTDVFSAIESLRTSTDFGAKSATSSNSSILTASAKTSAAVGTYDIVVQNLATTDTYKSEAFASTNTALATGTFDLQVGSSAKVTITLDESNNTLEGLKTAINNADAGARAFIVQDNQGYRLALVSGTSGTAGQIQLTNFSSGLESNLGFDQTVDLKNATFLVNGITVTSGSNTVDEAVEGLTLNLQSESTAHVTLAVANDSEAVKSSIGTFVQKYNTLMTFLNSQFTYSTDQTKNPPLAGNNDLRRIQDELLTIVSGAVPNLNQGLTSLAQVGVHMNNDGTLSVDDAELTDALSAHFDQVKNLFQSFGTATDSRVHYFSSANTAQAGTYSLSVSQAAAQAVTTGDNAITGQLGGNEMLTINLGSSQLAVSLTSTQTLADIITAFNQQSLSAGFGVRAKDNGSSKLQLYSVDYGSSRQITAAESGSNLLGLNGKSATGSDVKGKVDGGAAITGDGKYFSDTNGVTLQIDATQSQVDAAGGNLSLGSYTASNGYATLLSRKLDYFTDTINGPIILAKNSLNDNISDIDDQMLSLENRLQVKEQMLTDEYTRADLALRNMNSMLTSLAAQFASLTSS